MEQLGCCILEGWDSRCVAVVRPQLPPGDGSGARPSPGMPGVLVSGTEGTLLVGVAQGFQIFTGSRVCR